ncbi:MAG: hypothetical protein DME22_00450 [Verrucomicrobia bacterium]|nr:MAG: hypothetical protein DME22_00450 [Verrucomicrobiota bacterium]PYJ98531.1 MAG: hypothetical protein DME23_11840 [Verrucomicrobiota bacterium]
MRALESVRIDKWLWAVRLYRSRSLATEACSAGHVKIGGNSVKPSREVRVGEEINKAFKTSCLPRESTRPTRFPRKSACIVGPVPSPGGFSRGC